MTIHTLNNLIHELDEFGIDWHSSVNPRMMDILPLMLSTSEELSIRNCAIALGVSIERARYLCIRTENRLRYIKTQYLTFIRKARFKIKFTLLVWIPCLLKLKLLMDETPQEIVDYVTSIYTSIDALELSKRSYNCLYRVGIDTVEDILKWEERKGLMSIPNLGTKSLREVQQVLKNLIPDEEYKSA